MLPRRALKVILVCVIAIWASAGISPDQAAYGAVTPAQTHQAMSGPGSGPASGRDQSATVVHPTGDPDAYTQTGGSTPIPGGGNDQPSRNPDVVIIILVMMFSWLLQVQH